MVVLVLAMWWRLTGMTGWLAGWLAGWPYEESEPLKCGWVAGCGSAEPRQGCATVSADGV